MSSVVVAAGVLVSSLVLAQIAPTPPSNLKAAASAASRINLSWQDNSGDETGFLVYRSKSSNLSNPTIFNIAPNSVAFSDTGLEAATVYYYQVYACNSGACAFSNVANATTSATPPPVSSAASGNTTAGSPDNFTAVPVSACAVSISWNQTQPADGKFRLVRKISLGGSQEFDLPTLIPSGSSYSCVDNNFSQSVASGGGCGVSVWDGYAPNFGISYQIKFCPTGGSCSSAAPTQPFNISTFALPTAPTKPAGLRSSDVFWQPQGTFAFAKSFTNGSQVTLNFRSDPNKPLSNKFKQYGGFVLNRSSGSGSGSDTGFPKFVPASSVSNAVDLGNGKFSFSYSDNVSPNVSYAYTFKLYESDQYCKPEANNAQYIASDPLSVTVPTMPTNLKIKSSMSGQNISIDLSWNKPSGADTFTILRSNDRTFPEDRSGTVVVKSNITDLSITDTNNLSSFTTYYYGIVACSNSGGCSDVAIADVTTGAVISNPKASIQSIGATTASVLISWDSQGNFKKIGVERTEVGSGVITKLSCSNNGLDNYCIDSSAQMKKIYLYQIKGESSDPVQNPAPVRLSLNITPINGWAFGFAPPTKSASDTKGIGWIRLSSNSMDSVWGGSTEPADTQGYGVRVDDDGLLSGHAWSGFGYGWLSFNKIDIGGCPSEPCEAGVSKTGEVSGWARFTAADPAKGAWDGWVRLREGSGWGLCYGDAKDKNGGTCAGNGAAKSIFSGWAWGNDVTGWINFGTLLPPVLRQPTAKACNAQKTDCPVTLTWDNPMGYSRIQVHYSFPDADSNDPNYKDNGFRRERRAVINSTNYPSLLQAGTQKTIDTDKLSIKLEPDKKYGFYLRAFQ